MYRIDFIREETSVFVPEGATLLEAEIQAGLEPDAPCGGAGKCGKCLVRVMESDERRPEGGEQWPSEAVSKKEWQPEAVGQEVLACQTRVTGDLMVDTLGSKDRDSVILTEGYLHTVGFCPGLKVHKVQLNKPQPGEKRSEWERMLEALAEAEREQLPGPAAEVQQEQMPDPAEKAEYSAKRQLHDSTENVEQLAKTQTTETAGQPDCMEESLPGKVQWKEDLALASSLYDRRMESSEWYVIHTDENILDLRSEPGRVCFAAFDIGTTTVVGYLLDAQDGRTLAVESRLNPQVQFGADVIMRANYALEHRTAILSGCIRTCINELLQTLAADAGVHPADIFQISVAGNTCMHHLFLGISPGSLVHAPYTSALSESLTLCAADFGLAVHPRAELLVLPVIAGYVGADTCACLMALRPDRKEEITLLIDIGTNGEMVLGNQDRLVTCSTAAGPAFEGAKIDCGMRGAAGAVDHVFYQEGVFSYTTIDGLPAVGLCGSGLIDLVACLIRAGKIDESGRLESGQEDAQTFVLVPPEESGNGKGVYLTQKDVREVQLAKAAIAAGIQLLMRTLAVKEEDITCVYIAGAFGNYMDAASAGTIGMFPRTLAGRVQAVGNAAGEGAKLALLNQEEWNNAGVLARKTEMIELAALPEFQDCFVDELGFEAAG
ncbi:MAG: ASKHA domain-containing protein [Lachnospiraceae bacterium]|nr:ASKHA domain-containing protein [Lachnospiraceae bacterium]